MLTRIGVLVSGRGTNLQALLDAIASKSLEAEIVVVISNHPKVLALERAQKFNIPTRVFELKNFSDRIHYDKAIALELLAHQVDLVVLAGFMHIVSTQFLESFERRVLNVHPALLPENPEHEEVVLPDGSMSPVFRGINAVSQALDKRVTWTGCSVHLVTPDVDRGPVIQREVIRVLPGDTVKSLHERIQKEEHRILPLAIKAWIGSFAKKNGKRTDFKGGIRHSGAKNENSSRK